MLDVFLLHFKIETKLRKTVKLYLTIAWISAFLVALHFFLKKVYLTRECNDLMIDNHFCELIRVDVMQYIKEKGAFLVFIISFCYI